MAATGYSRTQIWLHWLVLALVAEQFLLKGGMVASFRTKMDSGVSTFTTMTVLHIAGGLLILAFALWRLRLRRSRGVPLPPAGESGAQRVAAKAAQGGMYLVLILLPVTGLWAWAGPSGVAGGLHGLLRLVLLALVMLHVAGAVYSQVARKTGIMDRMMRAAD